MDVMPQPKLSVLKVCGRQDGAGVEAKAHAMDEPNAGAVLRVAIDVMAFTPDVNAPDDVDDNVTIALPY